ncbi:hypothetical protein MTO96_036928, partial [Rhipicephalus appendiculatus]
YAICTEIVVRSTRISRTFRERSEEKRARSVKTRGPYNDVSVFWIACVYDFYHSHPTHVCCGCERRPRSELRLTKG